MGAFIRSFRVDESPLTYDENGLFVYTGYPNQTTTFCAHCQFVPDMSRGIDGRAKMDYTD